MPRGSRRRIRSPGAPKRLTDWIPFVNVGNNFSTQGFALVDDTDMEEKDGRLTVERVVGQVMLYGPSDVTGATFDPCFVHMGLILSDLDNTGSVTAFSPASPIDLEGPWMWLDRVFVPSANDSAGFNINTTNWGTKVDIDVHVRRKMHERQDLMLIMAVSAFPSAVGPLATHCNADVWMRTLVKLA